MQATMTVRTDAELKATFTQLCQEFGMSANTAMNVFMRAVAESKAIPFQIGFKKKDRERERLIQLFEEHRLSRQNEREWTLDEINAEIAASRAERRAREEGARL